MLSVLQLFFRQRFLLITALLLAVLQLQSCNKPTEPAKDSISVTVEDVSCTEAWLRISDNNYSGNVTVVVKRDDTDALTINLNSADTIVVDDGLLPNKTYTFKVVKMMGSNVIEASKPVTAVTLDTTSHNFTWQTFEFGEHSSSTLYDVAIIDENNIWAVGEIYMNDSLGNPDHNAYNAVHWDGQKWELKKISVLFRGNIITPPLEGVFAFSSNDIWFVGSLPIHGDGNNWTMYDLRTTVNPNLSLSKAWGTSSNNLYFVGNNGSIAHWNGSSWKKIESGTDIYLSHIWGTFSKYEKDYEIICIGTNSSGLSGFEIMKIKNYTVTSLPKKGIEFHLISTWFVPNRKYFGVGEYLYTTYSLNEIWKRQDITEPLHLANIKGQGYNDIFITGAFGLLVHYNGYTWKTYNGSELPFFQGSFSRVDFKSNVVVATGSIQYSIVDIKGIVTIGKRN